MKFIKGICISILLSCNVGQPDYHSSVHDSLVLNIEDTSGIVGTWSMCSMSAGGIMSQYNVCPLITFLNNRSGYIGRASSIAAHFAWNFENGILNIRNVNPKANNFFSDTLYYAIINNQSLKISNPKKDEVFYLAR